LDVASQAQMATGAREASGKPSNIENRIGLVLAQNQDDTVTNRRGNHSPLCVSVYL